MITPRLVSFVILTQLLFIIILIMQALREVEMVGAVVVSMGTQLYLPQARYGMEWLRYQEMQPSVRLVLVMEGNQ